MSAEVVGEDRRRRVIGQKVLRPRQQVEETLRAAILSGELKSGEMLPPETELARQFDVGEPRMGDAALVVPQRKLAEHALPVVAFQAPESLIEHGRCLRESTGADERGASLEPEQTVAREALLQLPGDT